MKKVAIILGALSLSNFATECSFMRRVIPGALIAGASAYVGGRYYYDHLTNSVIPKMIQDAAQRICTSKWGELTTYHLLVSHMQQLRNELQANNMSLTRFNSAIFRIFGGDESALQNRLRNSMLKACQMHAYDIINAFFARRIAALKSFHEESSHTPKIWQYFYDSPYYSYSGSSLRDLQTTLQQTFPHNINTTYVYDRYEQHLREARKHSLVQYPASRLDKLVILKKWRGMNRSKADYIDDPNNIPLISQWFEPNYPHNFQKRARIIIHADVGLSFSRSIMATVPVYYGDPGYQSQRSIYQQYITVQDIAKCLRSLNIANYDHLSGSNTLNQRISFRPNVPGYPFYIRDAVIYLSADHLPKGHKDDLENTTIRSLQLHNGLYKLPIYTTDNGRELTYDVYISPFEILNEA
jgi:hypothetical protein